MQPTNKDALQNPAPIHINVNRLIVFPTIVCVTARWTAHRGTMKYRVVHTSVQECCVAMVNFSVYTQYRFVMGRCTVPMVMMKCYVTSSPVQKVANVLLMLFGATK